jgi:hypothetical protein
MVLAHKPDMDAIHKIAYPEIDEKSGLDLNF